MNQAQDIQQLQQQNVQIIQNLAQINETLVQINLRLQNMEDLIPMRVHNAAASWSDTLQYPPGIAVVSPIPETKNDLSDLTAAECNTVARLLGLAHLATGASTDECQQQISDYLGCAIILPE